MLKMRAIYLNGNFEDYWSFHIQKKRKDCIQNGAGLRKPIFGIVQK
ncbi:MAG: hypothetical protein V2A53_00620 [bacterium]